MFGKGRKPEQTAPVYHESSTHHSGDQSEEQEFYNHLSGRFDQTMLSTKPTCPGNLLVNSYIPVDPIIRANSYGRKTIMANKDEKGKGKDQKKKPKLTLKEKRKQKQEKEKSK